MFLNEIREFLESYLPNDDSEFDLRSLVTCRTSLVFLTSLLASFLAYRNTRSRYSVVPRWPPGPKPWPIIGNMLSLKATDTKRTVDKVQDMIKEYGDIVHLNFGRGIDVIIISGTDLIHETFVGKSLTCSDRASHLPIYKGNTGRGVIMSNGKTWKKLRNFTMKTLKDLGVNKVSFQLDMQEEAKQMVQVMRKSNGKPYNFSGNITNAVSNVICSLAFNQRFDHDNKEFRGVLKTMEDYFKTGGMSHYSRLFLPKFLMDILSPSLKKFNESVDSTNDFIKDLIDKHRLDFDVNHMRDFTDYYLKMEMSDDNDKFSENEMFNLIFDLFLAGTETTSTTLNWMFVYLIRNQTVQDKCREEIHRVIGTSRAPTLKDKGTLPYTEAMILESQRIANIAPLGISHCTSEPIDIRGYRIPERTIIMPNLTESMTSERYWKQADDFKPERWLDDSGEINKHTPKSFMPFSIGPRKCAGDNLAKMEMFIFTSTLLQQLKFAAVSESLKPSMRGNHIGTLVPLPYSAIITSCI